MMTLAVLQDLSVLHRKSVLLRPHDMAGPSAFNLPQVVRSVPKMRHPSHVGAVKSTAKVKFAGCTS